MSDGKRYLVVGDLSQIEARALAWGAGQWDLIDAFIRLDAAVARGAPKEEISKLDIYTVTGRKMGMNRDGGKVGVLAGGYGGGRFSIQAFAIGYNIRMTEDEAQALVTAYREANPMITKSWNNEEYAAKQAIENPHRVYELGHFGAYMSDGKHLFRKLPSGRCLRYRNVTIEPRLTPWGQMKPTIIHDANYFQKGTRIFARTKTHGAKLVQGATQAMCRDILYVGMYRAEVYHGLEIRLHVHDELVHATDNPEPAVPLLRKALTDPIRWCDKLPLASSVDVLPRYRKT